MRYKLIYYYADALGQPGTIDEPKEPEWELFDLKKDPCELVNVYRDPAYTEVSYASCAGNCAAYRKKWAISPMRGKIRYRIEQPS